MDPEKLKTFGTLMIDYLTEYWKTLQFRNVLPSVQPGYLIEQLPENAPEKPESIKNVMDDVNNIIIKGITNWHSPYFCAFFPSGNSYPSVTADILSSGISSIGFDWITSPAYTELEIVVLNWLVRALGLPSHFLIQPSSTGGGSIETSCSESTLLSLTIAREKFLKSHSKDAKLVAYCSTETHCSFKKACKIARIDFKMLQVSSTCSLNGTILKKAIIEDLKSNLVPFFVIATLGTTGSCAFDDIFSIGKVSEEYGLWMHVDAAYAGSALICPEFRYLINGVERCDSFSFNPHKWMLINYDCAVLWLKEKNNINELVVDASYLPTPCSTLIDYRHWQISFGRRFRALKLWFSLRLIGLEGLRAYIRKHVKLAKQFESLVASSFIFEIISPAVLGVVCFRLKASNEMNETLIHNVNKTKSLYILQSLIDGRICIRFVICSWFTEPHHIDHAWVIINSEGQKLMQLDKSLKNVD